MALHQDSASPNSIVTKVKFAPMANASHQLLLVQEALILLDQVDFHPLLDQVALLQDSALPMPTVMKMQVKFVMLANASCPLL